jgi:hypothetical protein
MPCLPWWSLALAVGAGVWVGVRLSRWAWRAAEDEDPMGWRWGDGRGAPEEGDQGWRSTGRCARRWST